jgi:hypothetical protein
MRHRAATEPAPAGAEAVEGAEGAEGAEGNSRLTGTAGVLLLVLLFAEGLTILSISRLITFHLFLGLLLVPPVALKVGTTTYRFARYYLNAAPYVHRGPPHPVLRLVGPLLIAATAVLLGSGVWLLVAGPDHAGLALLAHKASFVGWFALMTIHVLGHVRESLSLAGRELRPPPVRGRGIRTSAVLLALVAGVALGAVVTPTATAWTDHPIVEGHR